MVATLEAITERFGEEMAPHALGVVTSLTAAFWKVGAWGGGGGLF